MKRIRLMIAIFCCVVIAAPGLAVDKSPVDGPQAPDTKRERLSLTEDQKGKMKELRLKYEKDLLPLKSDLESQELDLRAELDKERPNMAVINRLVDQISGIKADIQKKQIEHRFDIRNLLTPEQQKLWKARPFKMKRNLMRQRRAPRMRYHRMRGANF